MKTIPRLFLILLLSGPSLAALHADELPAVFQRVKNSVVFIQAQQKTIAGSSTTVKNLPLRGAGILIAENSTIMTAADIVQTADWIEVEFVKDMAIAARVESSAIQADVALLELENVPKNAPGAKFGDSDQVTIGQSVFVVGISSGAVPRMIPCRITGHWRPETVMENFLQGDFLEIDAKLSRQDAGAPLFNAEGNVIGIVSNVFSSAAGYSGMGFAIPSNLAVKLMLNEPFFWSGLSGRLLSGPSARFFNLPQDKGFLIEKISDLSPSAKLGLRAGTKMTLLDGKPIITGGDVVLEVNGISFTSDDALNQIRLQLRKIVNGGTLRVKIFRDEKIEELTLTYHH